MYKCYPQFTKQVGIGDFSLVNDAFLMEAVRKLDGNPEVHFSSESMSLVLEFGSFIFNLIDFPT